MGGWETHTFNPCDAFFCNFPSFFLQKFENCWHVKPLTIFLLFCFKWLCLCWHFDWLELQEKIFAWKDVQEKKRYRWHMGWNFTILCQVGWPDNETAKLHANMGSLSTSGNLFCDSRLLWDARGWGWLESEVKAPHIWELKDFFSKAGFLLVDTKVIHYAKLLVTSHYFCNQAFDDQF